MSNEHPPLHESIESAIHAKLGEVIAVGDFAGLTERSHPLVQSLLAHLQAPLWSPEVFDFDLLDLLPPGTSRRLSIELLRLAALRGDLAYIAEASVMRQQKLDVVIEVDGAQKKPSVFAGLPSWKVRVESVSHLVERFTKKERLAGSTQSRLFKILGDRGIHPNLGEEARAQILAAFLDPRHCPVKDKDKVTKSLLSNVFKTSANFDCLKVAPELFNIVASHLSSDKLGFDPSKGPRKFFIEWVIESVDQELILREQVWNNTDVIQRLAGIGDRLPEQLEQDFYERFIEPGLNNMDSRLALKLALADPKRQARKVILRVPDEKLLELASPEKRPNDAPSVLLHRTLKLADKIVSDAKSELEGAVNALKETQEELDKQRESHVALEASLGQLRKENNELRRVVEFEEAQRRNALESELDVARFEALKRLCMTHRNLLKVAEIVENPSEPVLEVTQLAWRDLMSLGVELIGSKGETVPCNLALHDARSPKGALVEIVQVGYILTASRTVILQAIASPAKKR